MTYNIVLRPFVTPPDGNGQSNPSPPMPVGPSAGQGGKFSGVSPHGWHDDQHRPIATLCDHAVTGAHAQVITYM